MGIHGGIKNRPGRQIFLLDQNPSSRFFNSGEAAKVVSINIFVDKPAPIVKLHVRSLSQDKVKASQAVKSVVSSVHKENAVRGQGSKHGVSIIPGQPRVPMDRGFR